jgi:hypothetical protein
MTNKRSLVTTCAQEDQIKERSNKGHPLFFWSPSDGTGISLNVTMEVDGGKDVGADRKRMLKRALLRRCVMT